MCHPVPSLSVAALCLGLSVLAPARAATPQECPYTAEYLSAQLGQTFKVSHRSAGLLGKACEYENKDRSVKVAVDTGPNPAPSPELWLKMANPGGTRWAAVAGDPDKALTLESYPNGEPYPSVFYARKGALTTLTVLGPTGKAAASPWNTKLLKLERLPQ